jgi:hypothetical protein
MKLTNDNQRIFGRSKRKWDSEILALEDVCNINNLSVDDLYSEHTATKWQWKTNAGTRKNEKAIETSKTVLSYPKNEVENEEEARKNAADYWQTLEANCKPNHDEEYWIFTKHKG